MMSNARTQPSDQRPSPAPPVVWAGAECAFLRVNGAERDQLRATGHAGRGADLRRLAEMGVRGVRQPLLWGWTARAGSRLRQSEATRRWSDRRLGELAELGVDPILALLHHGSGPRGSSFLDPDFPEAFAAYARAVAETYPWVTSWLPVNEPTTTARFAGLYGLWEPHGRSAATFAAIVVAQCRAIRAAMREVRAVNPAARLIVNEDVGVVRSTPRLADQAAFDNARRWAALDLLAGRLVPGTRLWPFFVHALGSDAPLRDFMDDPCPPDVIGLDYYVTSDRFLDHRLARYPPSTHGGNGRQRYADVELARVDGEEIAGWSAVIAETRSRYRRPVALTEVCLAGDPVDACAWWLEAWDAATTAGVEAVTAWAAFGARGWEQMLVDPAGAYTPGLFDATVRPPVATPLGDVVRRSARGLPLPDRAPGWWRRPERLRYAA